MKIIMPSDVYPPRCGGAGWSAHALALALTASGHQVAVIQPREGGPPLAERAYEGIAVAEVGYRAPAVPILRNYWRHERLWPRLAEAIAREARHRQAALIHAQHVQCVPAALLAGRRLGLPVVATVRDHWPWDYFATGLHGDRVPYERQTAASLATDLVARLGPCKGVLALPTIPYLRAHLRRRAQALAACDAVIAVSRYVAGRLQGIVPAERLHVLPNMVDLGAIDRVLAQQSAVVPAEPFLLFIGKLERNKGAALLPSLLAAALAARDGRELPLLVIAGDGPLRSDLERELAALGVRASFLGWVPHDECLRLLGRCEALLFPSAWGEPLSRVLLEAAACGAPVLAMPTGGTPDIIGDGTTGLLATTPQGLGCRLAALLADEQLRRALGQAARRQAAEQFAAPVVVARVEALYRQLVS